MDDSPIHFIALHLFKRLHKYIIFFCFVNINFHIFSNFFRKIRNRIFLQHPLLFKIKDLCQNNEQGYQCHRRIGIFPAKFGHIWKIHSIPPGNQSKRQEYRGNDRQNTDNTVLLYIYLRLIQIPYLSEIFTDCFHILCSRSARLDIPLPFQSLIRYIFPSSIYLHTFPDICYLLIICQT